MEFFHVKSFKDFGELVLIGIAAGVVYYLVDKYVVIPVETSVGIPTA